MAPEERIALIKENLAETLDFDIIEKIINEGRDPKVYWGTYVAGRAGKTVVVRFEADFFSMTARRPDGLTADTSSLPSNSPNCCGPAAS